MYTAPGQGQTTPLGQNFDVNRNSLSLCPFVASFKKNLFEVWFFTFFMCFFHMYIAQSRGRQPTGDKHFMTTERPFLFAHMLQVSKWSLRNLTLYTFLMILYTYIAPGQGQKTPWGQTFDINREPLSLWPFVASFKQISFNSDFIHIFPGVYSPRAGADNPLWAKFWCQQKGFVTLPICCKFQKNIFEVWFYTYFCLILYMNIAPGQGQITPWGQNFYFNINLLPLWSFAVSFFH